MERYDIAIIGTGPAGLSAAVTAVVRNKKIILIGGEENSAKVSKAHEVRNYLGLPAVSGADMAAAFKAHLDSMGIEIQKRRVTVIYPMGGYFSLQDDRNEIFEAETVILATGVVQAKAFEGEDDLLGRGVSYCATCDGPLYRDKEVAVISYSPKEEAEADYLSEICSHVYYFPMYKEAPQTSDKVDVRKEKPKAISGTMSVEGLKTDASDYAVSGVFILREAISPDHLVPGLETEGPHVKVDLEMKTNLPGLFACGDLAGRPYQYIKSAGQGNVAALSAVSYLAEKSKTNG